MAEWHNLLKRQIKRQFGEQPPPRELLPFLDAVNQAYTEFDEDRRLLERSLELSSYELLQANTDMRALFDAFPDLLFRVDAEGTILDYRAGQEAEAASSREKWVGERIQDAFGDPARKVFQEALEKIRQEHRMLPVEYSIVSKGTELFYEARFLPLSGSQTVVMIRDITERKKLESQLLQSQKMDTLGTLAGSVAHDLNNQLQPLTGYINLLLSMTKPDNEVYTLLKEADQSAKRCSEVVRRLVNFSKPSTLNKRPMKFQSLMEEIQKMLPQFIPSTIESKVIIGPDLWTINGNESELQSVLVNLIVNATDAMPKGGKLTIRVENSHAGSETVGQKTLPRPCVAITITDSGTGMSPDVLRRAFEPFFSTKGRAKGTGLGLSMASNIIKAHEGWIDVSTELGKGTAFQIYLPVMDGTASQTDGKDAGSALSLPKGSGTVLFVDDEEHIRMMGKIFLKNLGYEVLLATDGSDGVEKYVENPGRIAAVVSDMTMPRMGGRQLLKEILNTDPHAVVVLASGYTDEGTHDDLVALGAADFIPKPYTIGTLGKTLSRCLRSVAS